MANLKDLIFNAGADLSTASDVYAKLLEEAGGDKREAYNLTEAARMGRPPESMRGLSPELMAAVNRIADSGEQPLFAPLLAAYEGLKGIEQSTGIPAVSGLSALGVPRVTGFKPGITTQASLLNLLSSSLGPILAKR